jgi:hypothetical protein
MIERMWIRYDMDVNINVNVNVKMNVNVEKVSYSTRADLSSFSTKEYKASLNSFSGKISNPVVGPKHSIIKS